MPKVSVVVCAKNEERFIEPCLQALRWQTVKPEIIVIDGCSEDKTKEIAKKYSRKVVSDGGKGIAYARNLGWKIAKGEIVAYCDADARPRLDWVENIIRLIEGCVGVYGPLFPYDGGLRVRMNLKLWGDIFLNAASKLGYPVICAANVAFKKEIIKKYPFRFNAPTEDFDVGRRMRKAGKIKCFKELTMPISSRRYEGRFYRTVFRDYIANILRFKLGKEPKNLQYFEKKVK